MSMQEERKKEQFVCALDGQITREDHYGNQNIIIFVLHRNGLVE